MLSPRTAAIAVQFARPRRYNRVACDTRGSAQMAVETGKEAVFACLVGKPQVVRGCLKGLKYTTLANKI
jgi:hypothetical protein